VHTWYVVRAGSRRSGAGLARRPQVLRKTGPPQQDKQQEICRCVLVLGVRLVVLGPFLIRRGARCTARPFVSAASNEAPPPIIRWGVVAALKRTAAPSPCADGAREHWRPSQITGHAWRFAEMPRRAGAPLAARLAIRSPCLCQIPSHIIEDVTATFRAGAVPPVLRWQYQRLARLRHICRPQVPL
jgi:hypothetical protein